MQVTAELDTISTARVNIQHPTDAEQYAALEAHYESVDAEWPYAPVLVVEDEGNGYTVLDGHHRIRLAAEWAVSEIPAYVISVADYCALLDEHFDGCTPNRLSDLDGYIICDGEVYQR